MLASKRLIRLTFNQVVRSIEDLLGEPLATELANTYELPSPLERTFPPLNNPREGSVVIDAQWQTGDAMARAAGAYVASRFAEQTGCGAQPTEACAREFADRFVERAYRRPLTNEEWESYRALFDDSLAAGATLTEATETSVYAALSAPQFLYRAEFGTDARAQGPLSQYESASMLSYFLTDAPPDDVLRAAATAGQLSTPEQIGAQVDRILQTPKAKENLQTAMYSYFGISTLNHIVIDPAVAPSFNEGLRSSMMRETELFLNGTLWSGKVNDLLTSRQSYVNQGLANLYGVQFPPPGATLDADGFALATLPEQRSGILTQPGYLTTRSSPEEPSVVRRGLLVNASLLCVENPPFPEEQAEAIDQAIKNLEDMSEREQADFRASQPECAGCHIFFDAYGLALENFDVIGAYRTSDHAGRPIDPSVTLPVTAGGQTISSPAQLAAALAEGGTFAKCVTKNLLAYALAEGSNINTASCATKSVMDEFTAGDQSFSSLVRAVARSSTFIQRNAGNAQ